MRKRRRARKVHVCSLCGLAIPSGTAYHHEKLTPWGHPDNDGFGDFKSHLECERMWQKEIGDEWEWLIPDDPSLWWEALDLDLNEACGCWLKLTEDRRELACIDCGRVYLTSSGLSEEAT